MVDKIEWMREQTKRYMLTPSVEQIEERRLKKIMNEVSAAETLYNKDIRNFSSEELLDFLQKGKYDFNEAWMRYRTISCFAKDTHKEMCGISKTEVKSVSTSDSKIISEEVYLDIMTSEILSSYKFIIGALYNGFSNEDILLMQKKDLEPHAMRRQNGDRLIVDDLLIRAANTASTTFLHRSHPLEDSNYILKLPNGSKTDRTSPKRITNSLKYAMDSIGYSTTVPYLAISGMSNQLNQLITDKGIGSIGELWRQQEVDEIRLRYQRDNIRTFRKSVRNFLII